LDDSDDEYRGNGAKNTTQTWGYKEHRRTNYSSSSISNKRAKSELISIDGSDDEIEVKSEKKVRWHRFITTYIVVFNTLLTLSKAQDAQTTNIGIPPRPIKRWQAILVFQMQVNYRF
jgi:hypothetical protein